VVDSFGATVPSAQRAQVSVRPPVVTRQGGLLPDVVTIQDLHENVVRSPRLPMHIRIDLRLLVLASVFVVHYEEMNEKDLLMNVLHGEMNEKDPLMNVLHGEMNEKDPLMNALHGEMNEKDPLMDALHGEMNEKDPLMNVLHGEMNEKDPLMDVLHGEMNEKDLLTNVLHYGEMNEKSVLRHCPPPSVQQNVYQGVQLR